MTIKSNNSSAQLSSKGAAYRKSKELRASKSEVYKSAQSDIRSAIDTLGAFAIESNDDKAREVLANLSVLLFDLDTIE